MLISIENCRRRWRCSTRATSTCSSSTLTLMVRGVRARDCPNLNVVTAEQWNAHEPWYDIDYYFERVSAGNVSHLLMLCAVV
jgi:hypothetical protein